MFSSFIVTQRRRAALNFILFLGPAIALLFLFFILPVIVDIIVSFSDMGRSVQMNSFSLDNYARLFSNDKRLLKLMGLTLIYVTATLTIFNVTFGLILALTTTAIPDRLGAFFRSIWLLPRMSPSVVYALLWAWTIDPSERGLLNQILQVLGLPLYDMKLSNPMLLIIIANGLIGASMGMIIFTSAIRSIPEHLFHAAKVDGAGGVRIAWYIILPAIRWPVSFVTLYQSLSLLVSFEYIWLITNGGPFYDTTVYALYVYKRAFEHGQYAYGAAMSLVLVLIGIVAALFMWRLMDMGKLLQEPRIEVQ